jgi:hypothetical protein
MIPLNTVRKEYRKLQGVSNQQEGAAVSPWMSRCLKIE